MTVVLFLFCCVGLFSGPAHSQPAEYILKAGFLEKFARFTDWPEKSLPEDPDAPFILSVIGKSPFDGALEKLYEKAQIKDRPVKIEYISSLDQIENTHLLFVCKSEQKRLQNILNTVRNFPILVVSDTRGFAEKGTHINLYITTKGTLHFEINPKTSKKAGLTIQIILLEIAKITGG